MYPDQLKKPVSNSLLRLNIVKITFFTLNSNFIDYIESHVWSKYGHILKGVPL